MEICWKIKQGQCTLNLYVVGVLFVYLFFVQIVWADDALNVKRDNEKTVYTVGASDEKDNALDTKLDKDKTVHSVGSNKTKKNEEVRDKERSWDMLKNLGIVIDQRQGKPSQYKNQHHQTNQEQ
jgi:hypothetical protein